MYGDKMKNMKLKLFFFYLIILFYLEFIFKIFVFNKIINLGTLYAFLFSISIALLLAILSNLFKEKINKIITFVITITLIVLFCFHYIYNVLFSSIFSFNNLGLASQAWDFRSIIFNQLKNSWFQLILFFVPLILLIIFKKYLHFTKDHLKTRLLELCLIFITYLSALLFLLPTKGVQYSPYEMYFLTNDPTVGANSLGLITTIRLDIKRTIFGFENKQIYY